MDLQTQIEQLYGRSAETSGDEFYQGLDEPKIALAESPAPVAQGTTTGVSEPYSRSR
jgi:hypothetical protein